MDKVFITGGSGFVGAHVVRAYLNEGRKRVPGENEYGKRVKMITQTFDLLEAFIGMMESRAGHDFVKAIETVEAPSSAAAAAPEDPGLAVASETQPLIQRTSTADLLEDCAGLWD